MASPIRGALGARRTRPTSRATKPSSPSEAPPNMAPLYYGLAQDSSTSRAAPSRRRLIRALGGAFDGDPTATVPELLAHSSAVISPHAQGDAILIADPSMAGEAIAAALRARGFVVIEVAPDLLAGRALAESPRAIIVDVDQPGTIEAVERARELCSMSPPSIFCLGDPLRAAELGISRAEGTVFSRPIDIGAVVAAVMALNSPRTRGERSSPMTAQRRPTYPPPRLSES